MSGSQIETVGTLFEYVTAVGRVIDTAQRSDSYTTGASRTVVMNGTGGGGGRVKTTVVVNRDIWIRDAGGAEHHVRIRADVPVRVGQEIALVWLKARNAACKRSFERTGFDLRNRNRLVLDGRAPFRNRDAAADRR